MRTIDLGNNESASIGIVDDQGAYLALTLSQSRRFKTRGGAERWLARRGYRPAGTTIPTRAIDSTLPARTDAQIAADRGPFADVADAIATR